MALCGGPVAGLVERHFVFRGCLGRHRKVGIRDVIKKLICFNKKEMGLKWTADRADIGDARLWGLWNANGELTFSRAEFLPPTGIPSLIRCWSLLGHHGAAKQYD